MAERGAPLFLARRSYRRRRVIDAVCLLPVFGAALFLVPLLWQAGGTGSLAGRGLYLFGAWAMLILAAFVLARRIRRGDAAGAERGAAPPPPPQADTTE